MERSTTASLRRMDDVGHMLEVTLPCLRCQQHGGEMLAKNEILMRWKYWIQEKLYCTEQEALTVVSLIVLILIMHGIRVIRAGTSPFDDQYYARTDSLFRVLSARADSLDSVDTLFTGFRHGNPGTDGPVRENHAEVELWVFIDTLKKPQADFPLNINTATVRQLQALPRIGPKMARRIAEYRSVKGEFSSLNDLVRVQGIGEKTLLLLRPLLVLQDSVQASEADSSSTR